MAEEKQLKSGWKRGGKSGVPLLPASIVLTWLWVTALWCAAVVLSSVSPPSLPLLLSLIPFFFFLIFPRALLYFPPIIFPRPPLPRCDSFLCVSLKRGPARRAGLPFFRLNLQRRKC